MSIIIFSGTTEGRELSQFLNENRIEHIVCVATESGENVMGQEEYARIFVGRMGREKMLSFIVDNKAEIVIDATHPYASDVTKNIYEVCTAVSVRYLRVTRDNENNTYAENAHFYTNAEECALGMGSTEGNILLTTGSKEIAAYMKYENLKDRIYVRVLPSIESLGLCRESGVDERHIIAMYGPHSLEMNMAVIKQYDIKHVITKQSGAIGGYDEKCVAAINSGAGLHIITRPEDIPGISLEHSKEILLSTLMQDKKKDSENVARKARIKLVGIGTGSKENLTIGAWNAIDEADIICGAKRMIEAYESKAKCHPVYLAEDVIRVIDEAFENTMSNTLNVAVLFSGDTGVFSGSEKLFRKLSQWERCENIEIIPGISSFSAFAAKLGEGYSYSSFESLHGKSDDMENRIRIAEKIALLSADNSDEAIPEGDKSVFILLSGINDFEVLANLISDVMKEKLSVDLGYNISYPSEKIMHFGASEMLSETKNLDDGLFIVRIKKRID